MFVMQVSIQVKPEFIDAFKAASLINGQGAIAEPANRRFELFQQAADPTQFMLLEIYETPEGLDAHRQTPHFQTWLATVQDMFVAPRTRTDWQAVFPEDATYWAQ
jgi:(4S)-4-hydroxy-5-phosphonooxypentane-2,3-dione isomerase